MLFFLCGEGGSGKDSIGNSILEKISDIERVTTYTTRPARSNEVDGKEYHFLSNEEFFERYDSNKFLEVRKYKTSDNKMWYYATGIEALTKDISIMWGPYELYKSIKNLSDDIVGIYLYVPAKQRAFRMINRADNDDSVVEACRRLYNDSIDFKDVSSDDFDIVVQNKDGMYNDVVNKIYDFILHKLGDD